MPATDPPLPEVEAIAEHGFGCIDGMLPYRDLTKITLRATYDEGGEFVATTSGHLEDGSLYPIPDHGKAYRLRLVSAKARAA